MQETFGLARVVTGNESWLSLGYSDIYMPSVSEDREQKVYAPFPLIESQQYLLCAYSRTTQIFCHRNNQRFCYLGAKAAIPMRFLYIFSINLLCFD
jgi:hypothetical protein